MAENSQTAIEYINGLFPGVAITESIISNILFKTGIDPDVSSYDLTERERDLAYAYLILYLQPGMGTSQSVTDRDGDWEHSEKVSSWTYQDRVGLWRIAKALFDKWGVEDELLSSSAPQWGFKGTGFRKIRRYNRRCR